MKFKTHNDMKDGEKINTNGTSLVGEIDVAWKDLVKVFGEAGGEDGDKVDAEWEIKFADGTVATIYNWKDGKNYNGAEGLETEDIRNWHIGGKDKTACKLVKQVLKKNKISFK